MIKRYTNLLLLTYFPYRYPHYAHVTDSATSKPYRSAHILRNARDNLRRLILAFGQFSVNELESMQYNVTTHVTHALALSGLLDDSQSIYHAAQCRRTVVRIGRICL